MTLPRRITSRPVNSGAPPAWRVLGLCVEAGWWAKLCGCVVVVEVGAAYSARRSARLRPAYIAARPSVRFSAAFRSA